MPTDAEQTSDASNAKRPRGIGFGDRLLFGNIIPSLIAVVFYLAIAPLEALGAREYRVLVPFVMLITGGIAAVVVNSWVVIARWDTRVDAFFAGAAIPCAFFVLEALNSGESRIPLLAFSGGIFVWFCIYRKRRRSAIGQYR